MKECKNCKYQKHNNCYKNKVCIDHQHYEEKIINKSSVEIRLFDHKNNKVLCEDLDMEQLEHVLKVLDPKGWQ